MQENYVLLHQYGSWYLNPSKPRWRCSHPGCLADLSVFEPELIIAHVQQEHNGLPPPGVKNFGLPVDSAEETDIEALEVAGELPRRPGTDHEEQLPVCLVRAGYDPVDPSPVVLDLSGDEGSPTPANKPTVPRNRRKYVFDPREGACCEKDGDVWWVCYRCGFDMKGSGDVVQRHLRTEHGVLTTRVWRNQFYQELEEHAPDYVYMLHGNLVCSGIS